MTRQDRMCVVCSIDAANWALGDQYTDGSWFNLASSNPLFPTMPCCPNKSSLVTSFYQLRNKDSLLYTFIANRCHLTVRYHLTVHCHLTTRGHCAKTDFALKILGVSGFGLPRTRKEKVHASVPGWRVWNIQSQ
jgi:hypothetical protein